MFGLLAIFERGNFSFLAKVFSASYEITARRYAELVEYVNEGGILSTISERPSDTEEARATPAQYQNPARQKARKMDGGFSR